MQRVWTLLVLLAVPAASVAQPKYVMEPGPKSPAESLKCMQPRPGFTVELMACEPVVQDPIAFAWGPDGKFWVVEMGDYPLGVDGKGKFGGNVKILSKSKPDGPYDKATIFLDHLGYPTGVFPWGKGAIITCAPDIFYAEDTDGDGKGDKKIVLLTGFAEGNQQHRVNGLVWGLDNWVYGANGDSGGRVKVVRTLSGAAPRTTEPVNISGRDFRWRPDTGEFEAVTGQTQFGRCRDDWGNWFGCNNTKPCYHFVLDDHYLRRNPHVIYPDARVEVPDKPGAAPVFPISKPLPRFNSPDAVNHFTSACSIHIYRDNLFGPEFESNTFVSEPVHNLIHREILYPKGVTFGSKRAPDEQKSEFLASTDNWFRPTMIQTGPDGALWVSDMYRYVIEHPQWIPLDWQKKLDLRAGHDLGRIYRIYPKDKKPREIPRLANMTPKELVASLDSPSGWQRDMAQRLLISSTNAKVAELVMDLAFRVQASAPARLHALCTLDGRNALNSSMPLVALADEHPGVRRHALRLYEPYLRGRGANFGVLRQMASNPRENPDVRMQLAYSLGQAQDPKRIGPILAELARRSADDPYLLAAVLSSVNPDNWDATWDATFAETRSGALPARVLEQMLRLAQAYGRTRQMATMLSALTERTPQQTNRFAALAALLDALGQQRSSLAKLWQTADPELRAAIEKLRPVFQDARSTVADPQAPRSDQMLALRLLGRGLDHYDEDLKTLAAFLSPRHADDLQLAAAASIGRLMSPRVDETLLRSWKTCSPTVRGQVADALLARPSGVQAVLTAIEKKQMLPLELDAARRQRLLEHKDKTVRSRAEKLLAGSVDPDRRKVVDSYRPALKLAGDPANGVKVFTKHCAACHQLGGVGQQVGPDFASIGDKSPEGLLTAILDPNQAVEARYIGYTAVTKNGLTLSGLIAAETSTTITLVGVDGKKHEILRTDLDELFSTGKSAMPEGLEKDISHQDMADLLAFLRKGLEPAAPVKGSAGANSRMLRHHLFIDLDHLVVDAEEHDRRHPLAEEKAGMLLAH